VRVGLTIYKEKNEMANADKGNIEVINGSIGDLIFRIETLTSDRDTIKVCVRANNELTAMNKHIAEQAATIARLTAAHEMQGEEPVTLPRHMVYSMEDKLKAQAAEIECLTEKVRYAYVQIEALERAK